jgi:hypothetical protein
VSGACAVDGCRTDTVLWTSGAERSMSGVTYSKESVGPSRMSGVLLGLICAFGVVALGRGCGHGWIPPQQLQWPSASVGPSRMSGVLLGLICALGPVK